MTTTNSTDGFATISVAAVLAESAKRTPDSIALVVGDDRVSYGDLWRETRAYAGALRSRALAPETPSPS
jgi:long-chain acyl-CoA synthetase